LGDIEETMERDREIESEAHAYGQGHRERD